MPPGWLGSVFPGNIPVVEGILRHDLDLHLHKAAHIDRHGGLTLRPNIRASTMTEPMKGRSQPRQS